MLFRTACLSMVALLCNYQAVGTILEVPRSIDCILIASDSCWISHYVARRFDTYTFLADYACNCPNNCNVKTGSDCKYYAGPSSLSQVIAGSKLCHLIRFSSIIAC